jgi:hypothetical protein
MFTMVLKRFVNNLVISVIERVIFKAGDPSLILSRRNTVAYHCCSK